MMKRAATSIIIDINYSASAMELNAVVLSFSGGLGKVVQIFMKPTGIFFKQTLLKIFRAPPHPLLIFFQARSG
jgi:hypothetical protein